MSFTSVVKNELINNNSSKAESIAELSALFNLIAVTDDNKIKISTENAGLARHIYTLIKNIYNITPLTTIRKHHPKHYLYIVEVYDLDYMIRGDLSLVNESTKEPRLIPGDYLISDEETKRAYLRGLFLAKGSVNDPKTARYHLELMIEDNKQAKFICGLLNEFNLNAKITKRPQGYTIYIKEAEKISDLLRIIDASNAVLYFEDIRIYRDHKNMTNRLNNMEQANIEKMMEASNLVIKDIEYLKETKSFVLLSDDVKETAEYKLKYPDTSLAELSAIISYETAIEVSKSGINHRLRKVRDLACKLRDKEAGN